MSRVPQWKINEEVELLYKMLGGTKPTPERGLTEETCPTQLMILMMDVNDKGTELIRRFKIIIPQPVKVTFIQEKLMGATEITSSVALLLGYRYSSSTRSFTTSDEPYEIADKLSKILFGKPEIITFDFNY